MYEQKKRKKEIRHNGRTSEGMLAVIGIKTKAKIRKHDIKRNMQEQQQQFKKPTNNKVQKN